MLYSDDSAFLTLVHVESYIVHVFTSIYISSVPSHHLIIPLLPLVVFNSDSDMVVSVDRFSVLE